jgi:hypothetical protein
MSEVLITPAKTTHLELKKQILVARRDQLLKSFQETALTHRPSRMARLYTNIRQTNDFINSLNLIEKEMRPISQVSHNRYIVSSLFLHECFKRLTAEPEEQFFFITGSLVDGAFVLDQRVEFLHEKRSAVGVTGNLSSTHRLLIRLEQFGHHLLGHFHSHPGTGPGATFPSGIDENFQKRLESAGHIAVAAIFSRDGFVRFFRLDHNLEIEFSGTGVEKHDANLCRLTNIDQA